MKSEHKTEIKKSLGVSISKVCEWDGSDILDIMQIALEDSNFHDVNRAIEKVRADLSLISNMSYCLGIGGESPEEKAFEQWQNK
jgi:hypothetical protein